MMQEAEEGQDEADAQGEDQAGQPDDEAQHRPLQVAVGVGVDGGVGDVAREAGIALVELGLDLAEDSLLVLGKRHLLHPLSVGPGRWSIRRPDGSGDPGLHLSTGAAWSTTRGTDLRPFFDRCPDALSHASSADPPGASVGWSAGPSDRDPTAPRPPGAPAPGRPRPGWPGRWRPGRTGPGWRRPPRWRRPSPATPASSRLSWRAAPSLSPLTLTPIRRTPGVGSTAASSCLASRVMTGVESVASGRVVERVMVWKSLKRTLRVMVRPARPCRRRRLPTASARRTTSRSRVSWRVVVAGRRSPRGRPT